MENYRFREIQRDLDSTRTVMTSNVTKLLDNADVLHDIELRTQNLAENSQTFKGSARRLRLQMCFRNHMPAIMGSVAFILIVIFIVTLIVVNHK